jgi:polyferredoxin
MTRLGYSIQGRQTPTRLIHSLIIMNKFKKFLVNHWELFLLTGVLGLLFVLFMSWIYQLPVFNYDVEPTLYTLFGSLDELFIAAALILLLGIGLRVRKQ